MRTTDTYTNNITSEYATKPNFVSMVAACVAPYVQVQTLLDSMIALFDIDNPPVGNQLDMIGAWVGISRNLSVPIPGSSVYFSWDESVVLGWDSGSWQSVTSPTAITTLDDASYLVLIRAKIAANGWDGTTEGAYAILKIVFPNLNFIIMDNENMSYTLGVQGAVLDAVTIALITGGYIGLKPEGVSVVDYIIPSTADPFFGWDIEGVTIQGWDQGAWGSIVPGT